MKTKILSKQTKKKVLFVYYEAGQESLAIQYLSANLKRHEHKTDLIIEYSGEPNFKKRLKEQVLEFKPDFVGFSVVSENYKWSSALAEFIKEVMPSIKVIFGGIHVTSCPEEVMNNPIVDWGVLGEGDEAIIEIVEEENRTDILNTWVKKEGKLYRNPLRPLLKDLDTLPFPDKELFYEKAPHLKYKYYCIAGKGCPYVCTYCFNNYMKKIYKGDKWVRKRSIKNIIEELKIMKEKFGYKRVYFSDDVLTDNKQWLLDFLKEYKKEIGIGFTGQSHAHFLGEEVCKSLGEAGCLKMQVGGQSGIEEKRLKICKRIDRDHTIQSACDYLKKYGVMVQIDHIFKLPTETLEEYQVALDFYINLKPTSFTTFVLQYYPNLEITELGLKYGDLTQEQVDKINKGDVYSITSLHKKENIELLRISRFMQWIPIFPKVFSKWIVKKRLYNLFFTDSLNKLPFYFQYFTTWNLIKGFPISYSRKKILRDLKKRLNEEHISDAQKQFKEAVVNYQTSPSNLLTIKREAGRYVNAPDAMKRDSGGEMRDAEDDFFDING